MGWGEHACSHRQQYQYCHDCHIAYDSNDEAFHRGLHSCSIMGCCEWTALRATQTDRRSCCAHCSTLVFTKCISDDELNVSVFQRSNYAAFCFMKMQLHKWWHPLEGGRCYMSFSDMSSLLMKILNWSTFPFRVQDVHVQDKIWCVCKQPDVDMWKATFYIYSCKPYSMRRGCSDQVDLRWIWAHITAYVLYIGLLAYFAGKYCVWVLWDSTVSAKSQGQPFVSAVWNFISSLISND